MRQQLLDYLVCSHCHGNLAAEPFETRADEHWEALLRCPAGHLFPVIRGIPRMVPDSLQAHSAWASRHGIAAPAPAAGAAGQDPETVASFGFEWNTFNDYEYPLQKLRRDVLEQSGVEESFFSGKLTLEAGCGAGRQLSYVASLGTRLTIGIDLSDAVEASKQRVKDQENCEVVQADIYRLPFRERTFDFLYTEGMLLAVEDPAAAFRKLMRYVRDGGSLSASFYLRRKFIPFSLIFREPLRRLAQLFPVKWVYHATWLAVPLNKIPVLNWVLRKTVMVWDPHLVNDRRLWEINFDFFGHQKYQHYLLREQVEALLAEPENHLTEIRPTILGAYRATVRLP
jgi:SAM-dependent methyltransferase